MNAKDEETRTPPKNSRTSERGTQPVIRNVQGLPRSRNIRENYSKRMNTLDKWAVRVISENIKVHSRAFRRGSLTRESTGSEQIMLWRALSDPRAVLILFPRVFFSFFFLMNDTSCEYTFKRKRKIPLCLAEKKKIHK